MIRYHILCRSQLEGETIKLMSFNRSRQFNFLNGILAPLIILVNFHCKEKGLDDFDSSAPIGVAVKRIVTARQTYWSCYLINSCCSRKNRARSCWMIRTFPINSGSTEHTPILVTNKMLLYC